MLEAIPNEDEIRDAVFGLNADSTPGPDGFGGSFYQSCWEIIKHELIEAIQQFFGGTDDVIIFTSGGKRSLELVMHQLQNYQKCSGQRININKSCFLVEPKASNNIIQRIKEVTGYKHSNFPITYLGCPLYVGVQRIAYYSEMISKLVKRTTGWQGKLLLIGGKATLIRHVLQSQPIYLLSALEPPKTVLLQLESYFANFFWGSVEGKNKYHWSFWDNMSFPKEEGGLGFRSIFDVSKSLTMKRW
ncbi:uncharacterized protein LOC132645067 isoform X2 [Lycium barbarum]|uniref:uncharacterized protein LOC132645067 isoform X2 n=1 Tax=Lycium barbarum TaxID=112863 RepID=UPI00293E2B58|nr:uncharacterized protein LOC132645067 isoform X2 [Lycium barbarum]